MRCCGWTMACLVLLCVCVGGTEGLLTRAKPAFCGFVGGRSLTGIATASNMQQSMYEKEKDEEETFGDANVVIDDLNWRVEKLRLEERNTQRFLKAGPRFLPYQECRKWVQAWGRWKSEEDWRQWISMGEKRNSYIPVSWP